jgi:hypothetical protein
MHRMDIGTPSNQVSLSEVGFRFNDPAWSDKISLFEMFLEKNTDLNAHRQYYKPSKTGTVTRSLSTVNITEHLTDALYKCTDLTIG